MTNFLRFILYVIVLASCDACAADVEPVLASRLTALRDAFIAQIRAEGFEPKIPPPTIIFDNPSSYGQYDNDQNSVHISTWSSLSEDQRARFFRLSKLLQGRPPEQVFEDSVYHWVFIHELSHWWQASEGKLDAGHYSIEYGANRVAAAFWRLKDPEVMRATETRMATAFPTLPVPVLEGKTKEAYFNENYERLGPTPSYIWFQYSMVLEVQAEKPLPTFRQALMKPGY